MSSAGHQSRSNKFEKRRKNTKRITILMMIAFVLILVLIVYWIFSGDDEETVSLNLDSPENENLLENDLNSSETDEQDENNVSTNGDTTDQSNDQSLEINENGDSETDHDLEVNTEQVRPSDENVIEAYTANWPPIGTIQEGPHTTIYDDGSQDRIEIKQAVMSVTGLGEDLIEWRVANGGEQKVLATVSDRSQTEIYRVYLSWIDQQGWQPTKVEKLREVQY